MKNEMNLSPTRSGERGQAIILITLLLIVLLGAMALTVDGGMLLAERRQVQNAADNAALAGAWALCTDGNVNVVALGSATQNGYNNSDPLVTVSVHNPPTSGPHSGDSDFVEVRVDSEKKPGFAQLLFRGALQTSARAVAECIQGSGPVGGGNGVIGLETNDARVMNVTGSGAIQVTNGGVFVNSTSSSAFFVDGGGTGPGGVPRISGSWIQVVGGSSVPAWVTVSPTPTNNVPAISDPLFGVAAPARPSGSCTTVNVGWVPNPPVVINPGLYCSITVSSSGSLVMNPGTYYVDNSFSVSGAADLIGDGVFIYVNTGSVTIGASGIVRITAPTTGPFAGMAFFMGRSNSANFRVDGAGQINVRGTIYAPAATVVVAGSGTSTSFTSQFIARKYDVSGAGLLRIIYDQNYTYSGGTGGNSVIQLSE
jgi:hypothetical protein